MNLPTKPSLVALACLAMGLTLVLSSPARTTTPVKPGPTNSFEDMTGRYQLHTHGNNLVVFDSISGKSWIRYVQPNQGPTDWKPLGRPWDE